MRCKALFAVGVTVYLTRNATAQGVNQDRWAAVNGNATFSEWLDTTTIAKQGSTRFAWDQKRLVTPEKVDGVDGQFYDKVSTRARYNCETGETAFLQAVYYQRDSVISSSVFHDTPDTPPPGSIGEILFNYVCGKRSFPLNAISGDPPPASLGWRFVTTATDTSGKLSTFFVDTLSISKAGSVTTVWWKETHDRVQTVPPTTFPEFHNRSMFNCATNETRWTAFVIYLNGKSLSASEKDPNSPWLRPAASSTAAKIGRFACDWRRTGPRQNKRR